MACDHPRWCDGSCRKDEIIIKPIVITTKDPDRWLQEMDELARRRKDRR